MKRTPGRPPHMAGLWYRKLPGFGRRLWNAAMTYALSSYRLYLQSPEWHRRAAAARRHPVPPPPGECAFCPAPATQAHHRTYKNLGHESPSDLVPVCDEHHRRLHGTYDECATQLLLALDGANQ